MIFNQVKMLFAMGLFALMVGLFAIAFVLNRSHYFSAISTAESTMALLLDNQANAQLFSIVTQEREIFELHKTARELEVNLFIIRPECIIPACTVDLLESIPPAQADHAFEQGIAVLPSPIAKSYFERAARRRVDTPHDLYLKISAYFNLLEFDHTIQTVCCILTLLDDSQVSLPKSQVDFFYAMLVEQMPDLKNIEERLAILQKTADELDQRVLRKKGEYRVQLNEQTLSVQKTGLAALYSPKVTINPPVKLVFMRSDGLHREVLPDLFAFIPPQEITLTKAQILRQYQMGNVSLSLMLVLGIGLVIGLFATARRQRKLDAMKTQFIATVSHELRTPLSLIRLHAETLFHGRLPQNKMSDYHQTILTESERLSGIVNNVLDFSRMERGRLELHPESTNLSALCERIIESFQSRLEQHGFTLEKAIQPNIITQVDPLAYSQILFNLLDNAIKYSGTEKYVRIELEAADDWIILRVSDHGIGIPDRLKKKIFNDFVRSDDRNVTAQRGSGIGLSVARRLVEKMNGTIEVKGNQPKGSIFTVKQGIDNEITGG